jgi:hypothetical protein
MGRWEGRGGCGSIHSRDLRHISGSCFLAGGRGVGFEVRGGFNALHHVVVDAKRPLSSKTFHGVDESDDFGVVRLFIATQHTPTVTSCKLFFLLHVFFTILAVAEGGSCAAREDEREATKRLWQIGMK